MKLVSLKTALYHKPRADDFVVQEASLPECPAGGCVVRVVYLSLDPYVGSRLRGRQWGEPAPLPLRVAIPGAVVAEVIESDDEDIRRGDYLHAMEGGWAEYCALEAGTFRKLHVGPEGLAAHIGVLGMPGLTGWAGITQLARVRKGDTVLIDAAAGTVGGTAGQIARIKGARVVGIAGGVEECALVKDIYRFDDCIDFKADGWKDALKDSLPQGLTVFFENVSAEMAMRALSHAKPYARGVLCGLVDAYHTDAPGRHALDAGAIIGKRAQLFGLVVEDFYSRWDHFVLEAAGWIAAGDLAIAEDRAEGLEAAPVLFERLMDGQNRGKAFVMVGPERG